MLTKILSLFQNLPLDELQELKAHLENEIRSRKEALATEPEMLAEKSIGSTCYQLVGIKCGKKECKCAKGELHGPYWYACYREDGKSMRKYVGKTLPDTEGLLKYSNRLRKRAERARSRSDRAEKAALDAREKARKALISLPNATRKVEDQRPASVLHIAQGS